ncbi:Cof-type HAD-IIB family hydrolase [Streptococcus parauberis]|uniref:Putative phosphatase n=1 Tax=Streptococcus parauberis TaxID=1348 RepID=A0A0E2UB12_9STRE|nr:Cof-type HAD-IIB family hydrolase [Streptococcus parauberis]AEF25970.1 haloacid dehalogenase-like hydrolase [Streptococcus parauberis KCTC 11537]EMF49007.1 Hydrolase (HAD superfamily) [Streptococcus parauberis KRS-02109]KYP19883.1 putative phosphatase [Streptococcus parauberis]KYP22703.1 putative phosphatase [Streptococcus parauberis]KYP24139.1 putative phosphatase [Streptococcus parauberis]
MEKIIFSDIDGTLINDHLEVTPRTVQSLKKAIANDTLFVPVSARMPLAIEPLINNISENSPIISYNGALIQNEDGETIDSITIDLEEVIQLCTFIEESSQNVYWNVYSNNNWLSQDKENFWIKREEKIVDIHSNESTINEISKLKEVHKLLIMGDTNEIIECEKILLRKFPDLSCSKSTPYYLEIMRKGINKGKAVKILADYYHIDLTDTIAFGDNFNDIDMLQTVGKGYVMLNAPQEVKQLIGNITNSNNFDGIAEVLEKMYP